MRKLIIAAVCAACGLAAAFTLTAHATGPVTLPDLPGLGYSLSMQANAQTGCNNYVVIGGNGVDHEILIGDLPPRCSTAQQEQDRIDALLAAYPPVSATTTAAPTVSTVYETTTVQADPPPAVTVTTPAETLPAVTVERTVPEVHTVTETVTQTVTVAAPSPADPLERANDAATAAYAAALSDGATAEEAALAARSAGLNSIYEL